MNESEFHANPASMDNDDSRTPHIIVFGNPVDGFGFIGPFTGAIAAARHGNTNAHIDHDWWIAVLDAPEETEGDL